jgi:hypothetical protein
MTDDMAGMDAYDPHKHGGEAMNSEQIFGVLVGDK